MPAYLFYMFVVVAVAGALGVVINRNPVTCAFCMIGSFIGVAAMFIGLNAYFIGTIQILVYAGAIMVLFLFIIMLLDLKAEKRKHFSFAAVLGGSGTAILFLLLTAMIVAKSGFDIPMPELANPTANDVKEVGRVIYTEFNFPLQVVGVLLLVATVGTVVLSKRELK
tara:strand:+ start:9597 stop:10097 length:501 start_codon:yes stop_codon:yes gene_type:complete